MKNNVVSIIGILVCLLIVILINCQSQENMAKNVESSDFAVIEYDSCEYVIRSTPYKGFLAHKGNCKYCEKRNKK